MKYAIEFIKMRKLSEWVFMLDNASTHWSNSTIKLIKEIEIHCKFLSAYSSIIAPFELFFRMVKNKLRANPTSQEIWFNNVQGRIEHFKSLQNWSKESIKMMWIQFIKNKKNQYLDFISSDFIFLWTNFLHIHKNKLMKIKF